MSVYRLHPFAKIFSFDFVLLALTTFGFQNQHVAALEPNQEIRSVLSNHTTMYVEDLEA